MNRRQRLGKFLAAFRFHPQLTRAHADTAQPTAAQSVLQLKGKQLPSLFKVESMSSRRLGVLALATALSSAALAVPTATAAIDGSAAVISEVYGGGGNKGAAFTHDFIELYNPTDVPIDLTGYTVEYFSASGNTGGKVELSGTIAPHGYFLVQGAAGNGAGEALPTPDAEGSLNMSGSCLLYTSPSPRDKRQSRMPSSA